MNIYKLVLIFAVGFMSCQGGKKNNTSSKELGIDAANKENPKNKKFEKGEIHLDEIEGTWVESDTTYDYSSETIFGKDSFYKQTLNQGTYKNFYEGKWALADSGKIQIFAAHNNPRIWTILKLVNDSLSLRVDGTHIVKTVTRKKQE